MRLENPPWGGMFCSWSENGHFLLFFGLSNNRAPSTSPEGLSCSNWLSSQWEFSICAKFSVSGHHPLVVMAPGHTQFLALLPFGTRLVLREKCWAFHHGFGCNQRGPGLQELPSSDPEVSKQLLPHAFPSSGRGPTCKAQIFTLACQVTLLTPSSAEQWPLPLPAPSLKPPPTFPGGSPALWL